MPWDADLKQIRAHFSTRRNHRSADTVEELKLRGFFHQQGEKETEPLNFYQSVDHFIAGLHSRSGFSVERMGQQKEMMARFPYLHQPGTTMARDRRFSAPRLLA
jgi:hypothetical protein